MTSELRTVFLLILVLVRASADYQRTLLWIKDDWLLNFANEPASASSVTSSSCFCRFWSSQNCKYKIKTLWANNFNEEHRTTSLKKCSHQTVIDSQSETLMFEPMQANCTSVMDIYKFIDAVSPIIRPNSKDNTDETF